MYVRMYDKPDGEMAGMKEEDKMSFLPYFKLFAILRIDSLHGSGKFIRTTYNKGTSQVITP